MDLKKFGLFWNKDMVGWEAFLVLERNRMAVLSEHIREQGISRPTQIIALGKKTKNA